MTPQNISKINLLLLCLLAALILSGCGLGATPTPEPVTIKFTFPETDLPFYEPLVPIFQEANPHILVELNALPNNLIDTVSPSQTDIIALDVYTLKEYQLDQSVLGLNSVIENDTAFNRADFYPGTVDYLSAEGETWAVPVGIDLEVMYYSKDLFDEFSLPYPELGWDWDDFLVYAMTIHDIDRPTDKRFGYAPPQDYLDAYMFVYQHGGSLFNDTLQPTAATFNSPGTVEALQFYADLFQVHQAAATRAETRRALGGNQYAIYQAMSVGNVGMWMLPVSQRGGLNWPFEWETNWGTAPLPADAAQFAAFRVEEGYAIFKGSADPDACWQWITFLTRQIHPRLVPARQSLVASTEYEDIVGADVAETVRQSLAFATPLSLWQWMEMGAVMGPFNQAIENIVEDGADPQEALDAAQERADALMP